MKILFLFLSLACYLPAVYAQNAPLLSPDEAVRLALENNFNIRLSKGDADIAHLNNTKANAGMLPTVNFVANETFTLNAFQQKLANGTEFNTIGAPFNNASAGVQLSWTLFDGRKMFITKQRLEQLDALGQLNLQNTVQQTSAAVLQTYYEIVRGKLQEKAIEELIALNQERLRIAEARLAAGFAAQTDALQAKIDLNQRQSDLLNQRNATSVSKRNLNQLLVRDPSTPFDVDTKIVSNYAPTRDALLQKANAQNLSLLSLQKNAEVAALVVEENRRLKKPRITGISQFNAGRSDNGAGFTVNNTQAGLSVGAGLVYPLYSGGNLRRQVETARVAAEQATTRTEQQQYVISTELDNQIANYTTQQQILVLEESNVGIARENLNVSTERFRLGQTNGLEVQVAQNTLEQALTRVNLAQYNLKATELRLRLLAGEL